jgi:hypothetical protein
VNNPIRSATRTRNVARIVFGALALTFVLGASPATQPPTTATTPPPTLRSIPSTQERQNSMANWFGGLSSPDPQVREESRLSLLALEREDLPALRKLVEDSRPLSPSQAAALHDIVVHVYLSGEQYVRSNKGFLGVKLGASLGAVEGDDNEEQSKPMRGAIIVDRIPGFAGFRAFQNGDVVLSIKERPQATIESVLDFQSVIMTAPAGTTLHMEVVRQMRKIEVEITLDSRPDGDPEEEINIREKDGEEYWGREFAPLVSSGIW